MTDNSIQYVRPDSSPYFDTDIAKEEAKSLDSNQMYEKIIRLQQENMRLAKLAEMDALTGLFNRHYFETHLQKVMNEKKRYPPNSFINVVAVIDLDGFKSINDTYGHKVGDEALQAVAKALKYGSRYEDIIARMGGDEFICMVAVQNEGNAQIYLNRLKAKFETLSFMHNEIEIPLRASIGMAIVDADLSMSDVIHQADINMFEDKKAA